MTNLSCSSPAGPDNIHITNKVPVITGIYVTTEDYPDGNVQITGTPSYKIQNINVFPNPFRGVITVYPGHYIR